MKFTPAIKVSWILQQGKLSLSFMVYFYESFVHTKINTWWNQFYRLSNDSYGYGHITMNTPHPVRFEKLSIVELHQYWGWRQLGNLQCCSLFLFVKLKMGCSSCYLFNSEETQVNFVTISENVYNTLPSNIIFKYFLIYYQYYHMHVQNVYSDYFFQRCHQYNSFHNYRQTNTRTVQIWTKILAGRFKIISIE